MARIHEIAVQGLGGSNRVVSKWLDPDINVFFGKNGGGKTTLLRTIYSALVDDASIIQESSVRDAVIEIESVLLQARLFRTLVRGPHNRQQPAVDIEKQAGQVFVGKKASSAKWKTDVAFAQPDAKFGVSFLSVSRLYTEALNQPSRTLLTWSAHPLSDDPVASEPTLEAAFVTQFNRKWSTYSNRLLAEIKQIQQYGIGSILQAMLLSNADVTSTPAGDPGKAYELAKSFFARVPELTSIVRSENEFRNHYHSNPSLRAVMGKIEDVEQKIANAQLQRGTLSSLLNRLFEGKSVTLNDSGLLIQSKDGEPLTLAQLSTGEKQLLRLCVEVLDLEESQILLIDEPEMSLHVDWQKELLGILHLLNPSVQIIVATHSPEIMANIDDSSIHRI